MSDPAVPLAFAARARQEAARYGPDPWVFVRELLQNARDAGATAIHIGVERDGALERILCEDDGEGMSFAHARRYLFSLYASSKEGRRNRAGRFGVGFWSVLRFDPDQIEIASRPRRGEAWSVALDGHLSHAERSSVGPSTHGTVVRLSRRARDAALERRVADAVQQSARDLRQRDRPDRRIDVRVDGRPSNRPLVLPAPSVVFERGRQRGVVGLGPAPGVELFSQGLRVRSAAALPDLLEAGSRASELTRVRFPELADGVAPRALLEGGALELSLARRDARETRSLRRLVRVAQRELGGLVERQLERADPRPAWRRLASRLSSGSGPLLIVALVAGAAIGALWRQGVLPQSGRRATAQAAPPLLDPLAAGHRDLGRAYGGPAFSVDGGAGGRTLLRYSPGTHQLYLGALRIDRLDDVGRPLLPESPPEAAPPFRCGEACVSFELDVADGPGALRLPVPTNHRIDPDTVRLGELALPLQVDALGQPLVSLSAPTTGQLRYRSGPRTDVDGDDGRERLALETPPPALRETIEALRPLAPERRVTEALSWVQRAVRYSLDPEVTSEHRARRSLPFVERSLAIGAGDCDVQSGVLLALLRGAGIPARLAVGYVGRDGLAVGRLHAWVEYRLPGAGWSVADASALEDPAAPSEASPALAPAAETAGALADLLPRVLVGAALLLAVFGWLALRRRGQRTVRLPVETDLAALMRGALQRPDAFRDAPAIFHRRLLPLASGDSLSLSEVWERAHEGRLFSSRRRPRLAREAARAGAVVLDERRPEARSVAEMLGAIPLDEWDQRLREARDSPLLQRLEAALGAAGESWSLRASGDVASVELLEIPWRRSWLRYAVVPDRLPELVAAEALWERRPRLATLQLGEWLAATLGVAEPDALLGGLARGALREAAS